MAVSETVRGQEMDVVRIRLPNKEECILIQVDDLVKSYGKHPAVDHLSFRVEKGRIYGFLGPNGAGKTTTMNIMTGYIAAGSGTVVIDGHDILKEPGPAKACIGYLPEIPPLYPDMTVREYLLFAAELKKIPKKDRRAQVDEMIRRIKLTDVEGRLIKNISKGYKQRVGLAQALLGDPPVLILDEPMVGLDPKQIIEMRDLLKSLAGEHTILLSSHILSEISAVCDHIMILSKGRLAASGSPEELQERMAPKSELEVVVLGERAAAASVLDGLDGVASYTIEDRETKGELLLHVEAADGRDIRSTLSLELSKAGAAILSMNRVQKSLEDIFLELTQGDGIDAEKPDEAGEQNESDAEEQDEAGEQNESDAEKQDGAGERNEPDAEEQSGGAAEEVRDESDL